LPSHANLALTSSDGSTRGTTFSELLATPPREALAQELVAEIIQLRQNLDEIALRENKLRKAINFFTLEKNREARSSHPPRAPHPILSVEPGTSFG
jgi:hypothetical protein